MSLLKQIWVGIGRHRLVFIRSFLEVLGAIWLLVEAASYFSQQVRYYTADNQLLPLAALVVALLAALWRARAPSAVSIQLHGTNTMITVRFGDIFESTDSHVVVPCNDGFDGELGVVVASNSVHGQFIRNAFEGSQDQFEKACDNLLPKKGVAQDSGRTKRKRAYPIGTSIALPFGGRKAFLFALAQTDPETLKANADVPMMWAALAGLWRCVRNNSNGHPTNVPLVGAGQSGVGLEPVHLLRLILLSIQVATREAEVSKDLHIVLQKNMHEKIDLLVIKKDWG